MKTVRHLLTLVSTLALAFAFHPGGADAQTVAPVPAPTIITSAPYTITAAGYYQLGANLSYAGNGSTNDAIITINAANVTLDFGGHYLSGPTANAATTLDGIYAYEKGNLNIRNGTISHCFCAIYLDGTGASTTANLNQDVENMLLIRNYFFGVYGYGAGDSTVSNSRISNVGGTTVHSYAFGAYFEAGSGDQIVNTTVENVAGNGGGAYGIAATANTVVRNCIISNVTDPDYPTYGLYETGVAIGNTISNCTYGIYDASKYKDNVTVGCTTPFSGGTAVGTNN